jgi:hypothetical protein
MRQPSRHPGPPALPRPVLGRRAIVSSRQSRLDPDAAGMRTHSTYCTAPATRPSLGTTCANRRRFSPTPNFAASSTSPSPSRSYSSRSCTLYPTGNIRVTSSGGSLARFRQGALWLCHMALSIAPTSCPPPVTMTGPPVASIRTAAVRFRACSADSSLCRQGLCGHRGGARNRAKEAKISPESRFSTPL